MASLRTTIPFWILSLLLLFTSMEAKEFVVGGDKCSWSTPVSPTGSIQEWADTNRFIVGDILTFEYDPKFDTVLQVRKEDYERCNGTTPIEKYDDGKTKIELNRSGHFYFIGDHGSNGCVSGQRLTVAVISDELRHGHHTPNKPNHNHTAVAPTLSPAPSPNDIPPESGATTHGLRGGFMGIFLVGVGTLVGMAVFL